MPNPYIERSCDGGVDVSLMSCHESLTELDAAFFDKAVRDVDVLRAKALALMSEYLDLAKPCFRGGARLVTVEASGVSATVYRISLGFVFEHDPGVYWSVLFNVPLLSPPIANLDQAAYWPIELAWRVE